MVLIKRYIISLLYYRYSGGYQQAIIQMVCVRKLFLYLNKKTAIYLHNSEIDS